MLHHKKVVTNPVAGDAQHAEGIDWNEMHLAVTSTKTANYTLLAADDIILADATGGAFTLTLPTAVGIGGRIYVIKKIDAALANLVTIDAAGSETIDGMLDWKLSQRGQFVVLESDNANWRTLAYSPFDLNAYRPKGVTLNRLLTGLSSGATLGTTFTGVADVIKAVPFIVEKVSTFDTIYAEVTTLLAAGRFRVGIYADDGNMYPGALIAGSDVAEMTTDATGVKTNTFVTPIILQPGLYWLVWVANTAGTAVYRALPTTAIMPLLGMISTMGATSQGTHWTGAFTYAALPATFPAGATINAAVTTPMVLVRQTG